MRAKICVAFLALALAPPASAQMGSAHGFYSGMGKEATGEWAGIAVLTSVLPSEDLRRIAFTATFGLLIPTTVTPMVAAYT